jgi:hypothetical protein
MSSMASHLPSYRTSLSFLPSHPSPLTFPPIYADPDINRPPHVPVPYPPVNEESHYTKMGRDVLQYPPEVRLRYPPGIRRSHGIEYTTPSWVQPRRPDWVRPHPPSWAETQAEKDDGSLLPVRRSRRRQKSRCETLPPLETRARFLAGASPLFVESGSRLRNGSDILLAPRLRTVSSMQGTIGHEHTEYIILKESTRSTQLEDRHEVEHDSPFCDFSRLMQGAYVSLRYSGISC